MKIIHPLILCLGIVLLLIQTRWFFYNKKHPRYELSLGRSKRTQDILWIIFGVVFLIGEVLVVISFGTILSGIIAAVILTAVILPFFWGLIL
ncbi:MAG: hypothetical protein M0P05_01715 [Candidatus Colwellbacteria bacterium]|nr:hypothetical protein [Candidatus Colwellbacteria bacterium]